MPKRRDQKEKKKRKPTIRKKPIQMAQEAQIVAPDPLDVTAAVEFLEAFRQLADPRAQSSSKLISIKIPEPLLAAFRFKAEKQGVRYQTMIKKLMFDWIRSR